MEKFQKDPKRSESWRDYLEHFKTIADMLSWVWREFVNEKGKTLAKKAFVFATIMYVLDIARPYLLGLVFDGLDSGVSSVMIMGISLYILFVIGRLLCSYKRRVAQEFMFGENAKVLDQKTTKLFLGKSLGLHLNENSILSKSNLERGYHRMNEICYLIQFEGINSILGLFISCAGLLILDFKSGLVVVAMLISHFSWGLFINRKMVDEGVKIDSKWRSMNRFRVELLDLVFRVKVNRKENFSLKKLREKFDEFIVPDRKLWLWFIKTTVIRGAFDYDGLVAILIWGVFRVWQGELSLGTLYPIMVWGNTVIDNLWRIGEVERNLHFNTPSILSLKKALEMPDSLVHLKNAVVLRVGKLFQVDFDKVGYTYSENGLKPVLKEVSLNIAPGEKVGVIGISGAGKSTMASLLLRNFDPTNGLIKINGFDLREIDHKSWLSLVGYIPQSAEIFDGTIRENLLYGLSEKEAEEFSDRKLWKMMRKLQIDFGDRLTDGLNTLVGRNGIKLSGGQAQRLMIGAAVLKNPSFMIIDEATSSLDATTEKWVQQGLEEVLKDRGAMIITHRLNTIRRVCDRFIVLDGNGEGGKIIAEARSFEELAKISPEFRSLAEDQGLSLITV